MITDVKCVGIKKKIISKDSLVAVIYVQTVVKNNESLLYQFSHTISLKYACVH